MDQMKRIPGQIVWCVERDECGEAVEFTGYVLVAENSECAIAASNPVGYEGTISQSLIEETAVGMGCEVYVFPLPDVYNDRADAKAALSGAQHDD